MQLVFVSWNFLLTLCCLDTCGSIWYKANNASHHEDKIVTFSFISMKMSIIPKQTAQIVSSCQVDGSTMFACCLTTCGSNGTRQTMITMISRWMTRARLHDVKILTFVIHLDDKDPSTQNRLRILFQFSK